MKKFKNVDEYILSFDGTHKKFLVDVRKVILDTLKSKEYEEVVSYGMPAIKYKKRILIYYAAFKNHIGLYATPSANVKFAKELSKYKQGKGSIQFPIGKPLPLALISKIIKFKEISEKTNIKNVIVCSRGHSFNKSHEYPVCPSCWPGYYKNKK